MIRIVVDSGADFSREMKNGDIPNLELIPLSLQLGDKHYTDDFNLDIDNYLNDMEACPETPKTAAPSPELYLEAFKKEGSVVAVTISSKLSGSYNSAVLAKQMYLDEFGEKFIHIIDSLGATAAETAVLLKVADCVKNNFTENELVDAMNKFMKETRLFFVLEKFDNLVKNGRMNGLVAKAASMLSIKAICGSKDGEIIMLDKVRGYKKAMSRLIDLMQDHMKSEGIDSESRTLGISHVKCLDRAMEFRDEILKKMKFREVIICETGGIATTYADRGGIMISY